MKIPKKLKICGLDYTVELRKDFQIKEGLSGQHQATQCKIILQNNDYNKQVIEQTFFHELLHAIDDNYNNSGLDENQVNALSNGIYQVLKDNNLLK